MKKNEKGLDRLLNATNVTRHEYPDEKDKNIMRGLARMTKVKYDALIKEGFTSHQALELCKNLFGMGL
tara:strand:+ start:1583 stop:1786 length:204 start_codon:yes stop_codon:yes gene_type:complete